LAQSSHLAGPAFTLADIAAIPYINRCDVLGLTRLWTDRRPLVADWIVRMRQRPSFASAITAWWDDDAKQRFDVPREAVWEQCERVLKPAA
jgi:glutathione S-transferase